MARGMFFGLIWGTLVGVLVLAVLSLYSPLPGVDLADAPLSPSEAAELEEAATEEGGDDESSEEAGTAAEASDDSAKGDTDTSVASGANAEASSEIETQSEPASEDSGALDEDGNVGEIQSEEKSSAEPKGSTEDAAPVLAESAPALEATSAETSDESDVIISEVDAEPTTETSSQPTLSATVDEDTSPTIDTETAPALTEEVADAAPSAQQTIDRLKASLGEALNAAREESAEAPKQLAETSTILVNPNVPSANQEEEQAPNLAVESDTAPELDVAIESQAAPAEEGELELALANTQSNSVTEETPLLSLPNASNEAALSVDATTPAPVSVAEEQPKRRLPSISAETEEAEVETAENSAAQTPLGLQTPTFQSAPSGVVTNRLPSINATVTDTEVETAESENEAPSATEVELDNALQAYAAKTEDLGDLASLFSIILIDNGDATVPRADLATLSVPITIAIDPAMEGAGDIMQTYRDAGVEVLALASSLPEGGSPSDVAVSVSAYFDVLPQAIGVLDPPDGPIQTNRAILQPLLGAIAQTGHALVTYDRGLNSAQQAARRENVPNATVFRLLDGDQERSEIIKRYLDRAAFKAGKDGSAVVVGHSVETTLRAILEWSLERKDGDLAIVPVSAIMLAELG